MCREAGWIDVKEVSFLGITYVETQEYWTESREVS